MAALAGSIHYDHIHLVHLEKLIQTVWWYFCLQTASSDQNCRCFWVLSRMITAKSASIWDNFLRLQRSTKGLEFSNAKRCWWAWFDRHKDTSTNNNNTPNTFPMMSVSFCPFPPNQQDWECKQSRWIRVIVQYFLSYWTSMYRVRLPVFWERFLAFTRWLRF